MIVEGFSQFMLYFTDMVFNEYSEPNRKLLTMQKDLRIVVNASDEVDQPLHVGAAVNEVKTTPSSSNPISLLLHFRY